MLTWRTIRVLVLVMSAALCALAQTPRPAVKSETGDSPAIGAITGKVLNENGQPLPGALVQVRAVSGTGPGQLTNTNREGEFRADGLDRGSYVVTPWLPAYVLQPVDPSSTQSPTYHIGDSVTFTLIKGGVVTGTVTNANGEPVVAVPVRVQMSRDANGRRTANGFRREIPTDDRGIYRAYGLLPGTYVVSAGGPNMYGPPEQNGFETDVPTYAPSATRDTAIEISVRGGEETAGIDIRYRGEQGRTITGVVNAPNSTGFSVVLSASGEGAVPWTTTFYQAAYIEGFMFKGIADGEYQLVAMAYGRGGSRDLAAAVKRIVVRGADVSGIELNTAPLASISGRVALEETKAPECADKQRPDYKEIIVSAWHDDNEAAKETPLALWSIGAPAAADADGNFTLRNLAAGEYYFATRFTAKYWYLQSIAFPGPPASAGASARGASKPVDATVVWTKVKPGDRVSGLTVTLAQGAATLRGQLLSERQQVPEKLFVYLVPSERDKGEAVLRYYAAPVSPDGKIALHNIAPGRYWVVAQTFTEDAATPLTKLRLPSEIATRARLRRDAEAAKTEIELKPCQNVTDFQLPFKPQ
jgi:hypothetical protein